MKNHSEDRSMTDISAIHESLFVDDVYVNLKSIRNQGSILFLDGIAYINGVNAEKYSDIDYKLVFKGRENYILQLAKSYRPELTEEFSNSKSVSYDVCWFTTFKYEGVNLSNIPAGNYEVYLMIQINGVKKLQKIRAVLGFYFCQDIYSVTQDHKKGVVFLDKMLITSSLESYRYSFSVIKNTDKKRNLVNSFMDDLGNRVFSTGKNSNCSIQILGKNNEVEIHANSNLKNISIEILGDNNIVKIGQKVSLFGTIRLGFDCIVTIDDNVSSTNSVYLTCAENTKVLIGSDCMFATNNQIRTDDAHAIYDVNSGKRVNYSKDIIIGSHVWIGYGATLFGGANIGSGSVVGAFSLVNKSFPNNCVIAGVPAKVVRRDVFWERSPLLLRSKDVASFSRSEMKKKSHCKHTIDE